MMGYDQEDICEYLEKSFENLIWDWGYLALLIGAK
jgi:lysine-N-methylase